jgi:hypothetical protein
MQVVLKMASLTPLEARQRIMQLDDMIANKIGMLIEFLSKNCPSPSVLELKKVWSAVSSISAAISVEQVNREIGSATYPFFVRFEPYISNKAIDELLTYDFKAEILPGTNKRTRDMIIGLIDTIHQYYVDSPADIQAKLWEFVASLTKMSVLRAKNVAWLDE